VTHKAGSCASSKMGSCATKMSHSASRVGHSVGVSVGAVVGSAVAAVTGATPALCSTLQEPSDEELLSATRLQAAARRHLARASSREELRRRRSVMPALNSITSGAKRSATVTASVVQAMGHAVGSAGQAVGHAVVTVMEAGNEGRARVVDGSVRKLHEASNNTLEEALDEVSSETPASDPRRELGTADQKSGIVATAAAGPRNDAQHHASDCTTQRATAAPSQCSGAHEAAEALHERGQKLHTLSGEADTLQADAEKFALAAQRIRQTAERRTGKWLPF